MTNRYRAITDAARAAYQEGDFDLDLSPAEEADVINRGLLELVPREYLVQSDNFADHPQGSTFEGTYPVELEAALIAGGHLVRTEDVPKPASRTAEKKAAKSTDRKAKE